MLIHKKDDVITKCPVLISFGSCWYMSKYRLSVTLISALINELIKCLSSPYLYAVSNYRNKFTTRHIFKPLQKTQKKQYGHSCTISLGIV